MADAARSVEECGPSALWEVFLWEHSVPMALFTPLLPENADKMFPQEHTPSPGRSMRRVSCRVFLWEHFGSEVFLQEHWTRFAQEFTRCTAVRDCFEVQCALCCRVALVLLTIKWDASSLLPIRRAAWVRLRPPSI